MRYGKIKPIVSNIGIRARLLVVAFAFGVAAMMPSAALASLHGCTVSATGVSFGSYNVYGAGALTANSTITIANCSSSGRGTIALDKGQNGGSFNPRQMKITGGGSDLLNYNLYTSASFSTIWGDGSGGTQTVSFSGNGTFTAFGQLPAGQDVSGGNYSDTVTITISF